MMSSLKADSKAWLQRTRELISRARWKEDLLRGIKLLQTGGAFLADRSFAEGNLFRLRRELEQVDEKLARAFQSLGKRSMEHWESQQVLDEKERLRAFKEIELLQKERSALLEKIEALKQMPFPLPLQEKESPVRAHQNRPSAPSL